MRPSLAAAIVVILIVQFFTIFTVGPAYYLESFGFYNFILGFLFAVSGVALCLFPKSREIGQGVLAGSGILMLIGFATCTFLPHSGLKIN